MNLYNRFIMRTSGEEKFQAKTSTEKELFATLDFLTKRDLLSEKWKNADETSKNDMMQLLHDIMYRSSTGPY